jgi:signal transduction histidine kinase
MNKNVRILAEKIAYFFSDPSANPTGELVIDNELLKIKSNIENNELMLKRETQRTKDLITYLAHDLRTPLVSVIGYLNLMLDSDDLTEKQKRHFWFCCKGFNLTFSLILTLIFFLYDQVAQCRFTASNTFLIDTLFY